MSVENLKEYAVRCATEPELRDSARAIGLQDVDKHMRHAESMGLDWTRDDLVSFCREIVDADEELADLSEEELEQVAGGAITTTAVVVVSAVAGGVAAGAVAGAAGAAVGGGVAAAVAGGW